MTETEPTQAIPPSWQKGVPLEKLREVAAIFKARQKPLVFGAFGLVKERDVADAMASNALLVTRGETGAPVAAAIGKPLRNDGHFTDVAKREFVIPAGHCRISGFACLEAEPGAKVLRHLNERFPRSLWVELFEEDETARQAIAEVPNLEYVATKVSAGSEIKGVYTNAQPAVDVLHPSESVSLAVLVPDYITQTERDAMLDEVNNFSAATDEGAWKQHYSTFNKRKSWTAFALRGYVPEDPGFIIKPQEMAKSWKADNPLLLEATSQWTVAAAKFPITCAVVDRVLAGAEPDRVRLMRLAPGGELGRHADITDRSAGVADGALARLHLPLRTSDKVVMHGWDKRGAHMAINFPERALCYLDQRGPHRVENLDQTTERIHLVIDMFSNERVREMVAAR